MSYSGYLRGLLVAAVAVVSALITVFPVLAAESSAPDAVGAGPVMFDMGERLRWYHACPGDYNQDGLVAATDFTQLGLYFNVSTVEETFPIYSELAVIDGSNDGVITVSDITQIGANFNKDVLGGYNLYGAMSLDDYPDGNTAPSKPGAVLMTHVELADTITKADDIVNFNNEYDVKHRLVFEFIPESLDMYDYWWVRGVDKSGNEGTPGEPLHWAGLSVPREEENAAPAVWDSGSSTLSWYYYNVGDYNLDGIVTATDVQVIGTNFQTENTGDPNTLGGVVDTDGSGFVDQGDMVCVEDHYDNLVAGYNVYVSADPGDYPADNDVRSAIEPYAAVDYMSRHVSLAGDPYRPLLSIVMADIAPGSYMWVRPCDHIGYEGIPSNMVVAE